MIEESRKVLFREHFRDYVASKAIGEFDSLSEVQRSKEMAMFFAERIVLPRNPNLLPTVDDDLRRCVVDGANDQGVDLISREQGVVLIVQAKYAGQKKIGHRTPESAADFEYFRSVLDRLRRYRELKMNQSLREVAAEIDWENDQFKLCYITLRKATSDQTAQSWVPLPVADVPDLADRTDLQFFDETGLNLELRDALSIERNEEISVELRFSENEGSVPYVQLSSDEGRACYVGRVSGAHLAELLGRYRQRLFSLNIRNYIGDTVTNKVIKRTAVNNPDEFFFFNNGISALAERVVPSNEDSRVLICHNLSIVNGAQTVRSLKNAHAEDKEAARKAHVLVRLTEIQTKRTSQEQEFLDNLTKFNNTQNAIKVSDFRSNDKIQYDLRRRFASLPAIAGRRFTYKNKRSDNAKGGDIVIAMDEFTKTVFAFLYGPDDVFGGTAHVFDATKGGGYARLFGDSTGDMLPALSNDLFSWYAGIWFLCDYARLEWREESRRTQEPAIERRWLFYYALHQFLEAVYGDSASLRNEICRLSHPTWTAQKDSRLGSVIRRLSKFAFRALTASYKEAMSQPGFTHRNFFRKESTLMLIRREATSIWDLVQEHRLDYLLREEAQW